MAGEAAGITLKVTVTEIRSTKGVVRACLTNNANDFPKCAVAATSRKAVVPAAASVTLTFAGVKPGRYALALLHDENNNDKFDLALGMIPKEGYGFSRDAAVRMAPPKFAAAAFDVAGADEVQTVRMRYMF